MREKKSPLSIEKIQFHVCDGKPEAGRAPGGEITYDDRRDFYTEDDPTGLSVKVTVNKENQTAGVRRDLVISLVDMDLRFEIDFHPVNVRMRPKATSKDVYTEFPAEGLVRGHTYKVVAWDSCAMESLAERSFCLPKYGVSYSVSEGGLCRWRDGELYRTIRTDDRRYYVRFNLRQKIDKLLPEVMPELELRLYYPEEGKVLTVYREPRCLCDGDYRQNQWAVEFPFDATEDCNGVFYAELLCRDKPIAGFTFDNNVDDEQGSWSGEYIKPLDSYTPEAACRRWADSPARGESCDLDDEDFDRKLNEFIAGELGMSPDEVDDLPFDEAAGEEETPEEAESEGSYLSSLDHLTGLGSVKEKLRLYERVVRFNRMRADAGLPVTPAPLHSVFLGSPGTGKTTVAKMMGVMLHRAGVLSRGHVVVRERATLLGQNYNSESEKTLEAIEAARGGILFIDEAYQLWQPDDRRDPGKFVIETLLTALADEDNRDWMLILAGYSERMMGMFDINPGFRSRIPDTNFYTFDDFTEPELMEIAENYLVRNNYTLSPDARLALSGRLGSDYAARDKSFGNGRYVMNLIQTEILPAMAVRVTGGADGTSLTEIQACDIPAPVARPAVRAPRMGFVR